MEVINAPTSSSKERYAVSKDRIKLIQPGNVDDQLTEIFGKWGAYLLGPGRRGRGRGLSRKHADLKTADGHQGVVRRGHLPEREVMTGIGPVASIGIDSEIRGIERLVAAPISLLSRIRNPHKPVGGCALGNCSDSLRVHRPPLSIHPS
ncbi:hypothetical protein ACVWW3_008031 [Bradyrhizobium sp. LM2.9]